MPQYFLPKGMRYTTSEERKQFYTQQFNTQKLLDWFGPRLTRTRFAVIMGKHSKIFLPQYGEDADTTIIIDEYHDLSDVQQQIIEFLEGQIVKDFQQEAGRVCYGFWTAILYGEKGKSKTTHMVILARSPLSPVLRSKKNKRGWEFFAIFFTLSVFSLHQYNDCADDCNEDK